MSKRVNPFRQLTASQQRAIKARIELLGPWLVMGMSPAKLIVMLWADPLIVVHHCNKGAKSMSATKKIPRKII